MVPWPARASVHGSSSGSFEKEAIDDLGDADGLLNLTLFHLSYCDYTELTGPEVDAAHYIKLVIFPLLLLQGIIGNLLAIPVLCSLSKSAWSTIWYLALLGITDLIILVLDCGNLWYTEMSQFSPSAVIQGSSDAMCKTYLFLFSAIKHLSPWLLVSAAVEMCIATRWPQWAYTMCSMERARNVLLLLIILVVCLDINHFWTWGVLHHEFGCRYTEQFSESLMTWIWPLINGLVELLLPLLLVAICFFPTATTMIRRSSQEDKELTAWMRSYFLQLDTLFDFRTICLVLSLIFMGLTIFKITLNIIGFLFSRDFLGLDCAAQDKLNVNLGLAQAIEMAFTYAFYSCKIYIYGTMSVEFRSRLHKAYMHTVKKLTMCCRHAKHRWSPTDRTASSTQSFLPTTNHETNTAEHNEVPTQHRGSQKHSGPDQSKHSAARPVNDFGTSPQRKQPSDLHHTRPAKTPTAVVPPSNHYDTITEYNTARPAPKKHNVDIVPGIGERTPASTHV